jgi:hypothetical protein
MIVGIQPRQPAARAPEHREGSAMNFMLIMKNEKSDLMAIGPVALEYQAAVLRDEIEESSAWTSVGIARVLTEAQARDASTAGLR